MREPEVALVFSPESWVEGLHRHLTDHGGARVRQVVMDPALALEEEYETLIVSHRWPALNRTLVEALHARRRRLLGVFDREEPAGREYLCQLGVDRVIESDAPMSDFLVAVCSLTPTENRPSSDGDRIRELIPVEHERTGGGAEGPLLVVSGPRGSGATEISIEISRGAAAEAGGIILVDADDVGASVAQRLARPIEPNLHTAVDAVEYGLGELGDSVVHAPGGAFGVVCGLPNVSSWSQVRPGEVVDVITALRASHRVVANVAGELEDLVVGVGRNRNGVARAVIADATLIVAVGSGTPVGVTRLLAWLADVRSLTSVPVQLVVNRGPVDAFRRAEIADELRRNLACDGLWFVPDDPRVYNAAWAGALVTSGPFTRAVAPLARAVLSDGRVSPARRRGR